MEDDDDDDDCIPAAADNASIIPNQYWNKDYLVITSVL